MAERDGLILKCLRQKGHKGWHLPFLMQVEPELFCEQWLGSNLLWQQLCKLSPSPHTC